VVHLNTGQVRQIQADDGQNSPGDGASEDSPSSMKGLNVQEFFAPPLPFDGELLANLSNSTEWAGMALPGEGCPSMADVRPNIDAHIMVQGWNWIDGLQPSGEMQ
jgi:hypothetical protein